jgi:hypothetical protein
MAERKHTFPAVSDHGTVLKPDQVAVAFDPEKGYEILLPPDTGGELPPQAVALVAAAVRLSDDQDFLKEMVEWLESRQAY